MIKAILPFLLLFLCFHLNAQVTIHLINPSFEDFPYPGSVNDDGPMGWINCGPQTESAPDVQPSNDPNFLVFGVTTPPFDGNTYIGMVARKTDTWERVGQKLLLPLVQGKSYQFKVHLAKSSSYISPSIQYDKTDNFDKPLSLRIWGSQSPCERSELLATSPLIDHSDWEEYRFVLTPENNWDYILLEVFYKTPTLIPYNGNLLVDNCSPIIEITNGKSTANISADQALMPSSPQKSQTPFFDDQPYFESLPGRVIYFFYQKTQQDGLHQFITNHLNNHQLFRESLLLLEYPKTLAVFEKTLDIYQRKSNSEAISKDEEEYLKKCDAHLYEACWEEKFQDNFAN